MFNKNQERPNIIKNLDDEEIKKTIISKILSLESHEVHKKIDYECFLDLFQYIFKLEKHIELSDNLITRLTRDADVELFLKNIKE